MIIKKNAETTVDESVFFGTVTVETENKNKWENVVRILENARDETFVCHCNIKENAELIARILDYDIENFVFGENLYKFTNEKRESFQAKYDSYKSDFLDEKDDQKRLCLSMCMGVIRDCITAFDDVLHKMETIMQEEKPQECEGK